jgi:hypothetical protein
VIVLHAAAQTAASHVATQSRIARAAISAGLVTVLPDVRGSSGDFSKLAICTKAVQSASVTNTTNPFLVLPASSRAMTPTAIKGHVISGVHLDQNQPGDGEPRPSSRTPIRLEGLL